jgi:hypothetical protein
MGVRRRRGAKAAGMGEAYSGVTGEAVAMQYNPGSLAFMKNMQLSALYQRGLVEDNFGSLIWGKNYSFGSLGSEVLYSDTGEIGMYDLTGNEINKVGQREIIASLGYAKLLGKKASLGASIKGISSEIFGEKATAAAIDIGAQYQGIVKKVDIGLSVLNVGTPLTYVNEHEKLPAQIRLGGVYRIMEGEHGVSLNLDMPYFMVEKETLGLIGLQYMFHHMVALRGGYKINLTDSSRDDEQAVNIGAGFTLGSYSIDYAIGIAENLDNPQRISFTAMF